MSIKKRSSRKPTFSRKVLCVGCAVVALLTGGCAPGLGSSFPLTRVETVPVDEVAARDVRGIRVRWLEMKDSRPSLVVAEINGRELEGQQDPAAAAKRIVEAQFREAGVKPSLFEGPEIVAELLEWKVSIAPGFPSTKMEARASVRLAVLQSPAKDSMGKEIAAETKARPAAYAARYSGVVFEEHPIGSSERIERVLAQSLAEAAAEALNDERFVEELRKRAAM